MNLLFSRLLRAFIGNFIQRSPDPRLFRDERSSYDRNHSRRFLEIRPRLGAPSLLPSFSPYLLPALPPRSRFPSFPLLAFPLYRFPSSHFFSLSLSPSRSLSHYLSLALRHTRTHTHTLRLLRQPGFSFPYSRHPEERRTSETRLGCCSRCGRIYSAARGRRGDGGTDGRRIR